MCDHAIIGGGGWTKVFSVWRSRCVEVCVICMDALLCGGAV